MAHNDRKERLPTIPEEPEENRRPIPLPRLKVPELPSIVVRPVPAPRRFILNDSVDINKKYLDAWTQVVVVTADKAVQTEDGSEGYFAGSPPSSDVPVLIQNKI